MKVTEAVFQRPGRKQAQDTRVRTPGSSPVSVPGGLGHKRHGTIMAPRSVPATVLGACNAPSPPLCPTTPGGRYYYCPDFLDLGATVKRGHRSGSRSHSEEGGGARHETQVCALDPLAESHPHGASVFSLVNGLCLPHRALGHQWPEGCRGSSGQGSVSG